MKNWKNFSLGKKIGLSALMIFVLIVLSLGIQVAVNLGIDPISSSPDESYDTGGAERLLYYYDQEINGGGAPDGITLSDDFVQSELAGALQYVDGRYDCADFRVNTLVRLYLDYGDVLPASAMADIETALLGFKYWMDQGGEDSMCYWSENHQILFATEEYLVGQTFPTEVFAVDGKTGVEHMAMAKKRVEAWMELRFNYGFTEWYSNNYYPEDISPMANFIQFAQDDELVNRMKMIMDIIWIDLASQCWKYTGVDAGGDPRTYYVFLSSSGRMYSDNRVSDDVGNRLRNYTDFVLQPDETKDFEGSWSTSGNGFFNCFKQMMQATDENSQPYYTIPAVILAMFDDPAETKIVRSSQSLDVEELAEEGLLGQDDKSIMMQFDMEAFSNAAVIDNTIRYIAKNHMFSNEFLNDFKLVNIWLVRATRTLGAVSRLLHPSTDGKAIERANVYTYKTAAYSMSTAQGYQVGEYADQHAISQTSLSNSIAVFTTQPAKIPRRSGTPTYWAGNGRNPYSVQEKNVNISIYLPPTKVGFMEPMIIEKTTHAFFPTQLFDEVNLSALDSGMVFAQVDGSYIALIARYPLVMKTFAESTVEGNFDDMLVRGKTDTVITEPYDLVQTGEGTHYWITEVSSESEETFAAFIARIQANTVLYEESAESVTYQTILDGDTALTTLSASYISETFAINGVCQDLQYDRYESTYVENGSTARNAAVLVYEFGGRKLTLDYENNTRIEE